MIEIEYIVKDSHGVERLRTTDKKAADAYDRALDNAERLAEMIRADGVLASLSDTDLEELTIYLARNARDVERVLKGKAPERDAAETPAPATDNIAPIKATG
ncbi:YebG family protein [Thiorhodococcus minor]|uniref:YebG family protein n=1 Tax=Thiorhodococcus minor TaxID=57489 RepID=A0A6M0K6P6_9GAMM|nr:YebG family protein [Thiorhodococcus minor]NEV64583.1 YebG family protein [Thiorhodococcus minor]